jgi:hypothetical protein
MLDADERKFSLNAGLAVRATVFLESAVEDVVGRVYGCEPFSLPVSFAGAPVQGFCINRPWKKQLTLAPYNFQPVLRDLNADIANALINRAKTMGPRWSVRLRLHHALDNGFVEALRLGVTQEAVETLVSLAEGFDGMAAGMQPRQRTKWRKALSMADAAGLTVREFHDTETLQAFYRLFVRIYRKKHRMLPQPRVLFEQLLALPPGVRSARAYAVHDKKTSSFLGGLFVLTDEVQWCYVWGATSQTGSYPDLSTLLIGMAMRDAAAAGARVFSLGASPLSHESLRQFKRNWGGEEHPILTYHWREPAREVDLHAGYPLAKALVARSPLWLLRGVSAPAVKWLA